MDHKLSMNALIFALVMGAVLCFGAFVLYGAWIDGRRQNLREHGVRPTTESNGTVHAAEASRDEMNEREDDGE